MSKQRGYTHIVVLVITIVIAIVLVGAAWWYETKKEQKNTNVNTTITNKVANTEVNVNTNTNINTNAVIDETADWMTYTNTNYGYSIKYPENWIVKERNVSTVGDFVSVLPPDWEEKSTLETGPGVAIYKYDEVISGDLATNSHKQVINGVTVTRQNENGLVGSSVTYFPYGKEYIRFGWQSPSESSYPEYEIILSTFTFTK